MKTVSLEVATLLTTANIFIPSESYWVYRGRDDEERPVWEQMDSKEKYEECTDFPCHSAPNADELAEVLPEGVFEGKDRDRKYLHIYYIKDSYSEPRRIAWRAYLAPINELHHMHSYHIEAETLADVMAKMLIYIKRGGII